MHPALKYTLVTLGALVVLLIAAVLVLGLMDWNALKGPVARIASQSTGKQITIDGDLKAKLLSSHPHFSVEGLKVANPRWAGRSGNLAEVGRLAVELELWLLFIGNFVLSRVEVDRSTVVSSGRQAPSTAGNSNCRRGGLHGAAGCDRKFGARLPQNAARKRRDRAEISRCSQCACGARLTRCVANMVAGGRTGICRAAGAHPHESARHRVGDDLNA